MNRTTIIAIFAIFFAPVVIAVLMHSQWFEWRPAETRNHGELIDPPHELPDFELRDANGAVISRDSLTGHWQLLHVYPGNCGEECVESLYWMRQVRRAQDRHQDELELLLATDQTLAPQAHVAIDELQAGIRVLAGESGRKFIELLPEPPDSPVSYILDPAAHIILRYPHDSDFNGMRRDLRRLLTWTRTDPANTDSPASDS